MLNYDNKRKTIHFCSALLFFISHITFQSIGFASSVEETAQKYRDIGYEEQRKGNLNEALTYFTKAIGLGFENPVIFNDMGVLYEQLGILKRAEGYYKKAIAYDADYLPPYMNIAYIYKKQGDTEQSINYFLERIQRSSFDDPWAQRAKKEIISMRPEYRDWLLLLEAKHLDNVLAMEAHELFIDQLSRSDEHYKLGITYLESGIVFKAIREFNTALELTPNNPKVLKAKKMALLSMSAEQLKASSERAIRMLEEGDSLSAKGEIQKMLSSIPDEATLNSK